MSTLKVAMGDMFLDAFAAIPRAKQRKVMEFLAKFRHNPRSSGINYEKIHAAADANIRSVRIDQDYRGIVLSPERGDVYVLLWVDRHDDAYEWARRHRCDIHPTTGSLQLLEVRPGLADAAPLPSEPPPKVADAEVAIEEPAAPPAAAAAEPIVSLDPDTLLRFGVPPDQLGAVQALRTVDELEEAEKWLPKEAYEVLYLHAAGTPLEQLVAEGYGVPKESAAPVDTTDFAAALETEGSRRRFTVLDSELELMEMLEAPLERWRIFLHPSQRRLVERPASGPVRVLGGAGTGKTVVAMHRAVWLAQKVLAPGERVLFTTFTSNLATDIAENLKKLAPNDIVERIRVEHLDSWIHSTLRQLRFSERVIYPGDSGGPYSECWKRAETQIPDGLGLPLTFYREEWERVVLPSAVSTAAEYAVVSRAGRGVALSRKQRALIWPVFEEMRLQLRQRRLITQEDALREIGAAVARGEPGVPTYRAAVVDESQDFSADMLSLVRKLVPKRDNDLFLVGDGHQRIYNRRAVLSRCDIDIRGRGHKLRINYRTTEEIRRLASRVLEGHLVDDLDGGTDSSVGYRSLMHGGLPVVKRFATLAEEADWLRDAIEDLHAEGIERRDMCLVARTTRLVDAYADALTRLGVDVKRISRNEPDHRKDSSVRIATMHRVKGLEFKAVFMAGMNHGIVPLDEALRTEDPVELESRGLSERALFHVAATRAIRCLYLSCHGTPSELLDGDGVAA